MSYNPSIILKKEYEMRDPKNLEEWTKFRDSLDEYLQTISTADHTDVGKNGSFCPYIIFVRFDALKKEDYPNNISENSVYITFEIDLFEKSVEVFQNGSIWLSPADKTTDKYRYMAMKSMTKVLVDNGGKKFRKQGFKNVKDLADKMHNYYKIVMKEVTEYTGGYPYKQGIKEVA